MSLLRFAWNSQKTEPILSKQGVRFDLGRTIFADSDEVERFP